MEQFPKLLTIIKVGGIIICSFLYYHKYKLIKGKKVKIEKLNSRKIYCPSEISKVPAGQQFLMKAKIVNTGFKRNYKIPIYYNQYYMYEPLDSLMLSIMRFCQASSASHSSDVCKVEGTDGHNKILKKIGTPVGDLFSVDRRFVKQELGFLKKIWGNISYFFDRLLRPFRRKASMFQQQPIARYPMFQGPKIGQLFYSITLLQGCYFIFHCKIQNGQITAQFIAKSKNQLIQFLYSQITEEQFKSYLLLLAIIVSMQTLSKDIRRIYRSLKLRLINNAPVFQVREPAQEKACIICYASTRNLIMLDCKHLIMCRNCYEELGTNQCPICKNVVTDTKVIVKIE